MSSTVAEVSTMAEASDSPAALEVAAESAGGDWRDLIVRAAKPGRDTTMVCLLLVVGGRYPVEDVLAATPRRVNKLLNDLYDGDEFCVHADSQIAEYVKDNGLGLDDFLFPGYRTLAKSELAAHGHDTVVHAPLGRHHAFRIVQAALRAAGFGGGERGTGFRALWSTNRGSSGLASRPGGEPIADIGWRRPRKFAGCWGPPASGFRPPSSGPPAFGGAKGVGESPVADSVAVACPGSTALPPVHSADEPWKTFPAGPRAEAVRLRVERDRRADQRLQGPIGTRRGPIVARPPTPEAVLRRLILDHGDAVIVLPTAIASARESESFLHVFELQQLLVRLATAYWEARVKNDPLPHRVFARHAFAAHEGKKVRCKAKLVRARTFDYGGEDILMEKHLKIGGSFSIAETIRVHFEWDPILKVVVIGHCGPHLPLK